jgi:predicted RNA-binding Zn ribbon-like protein
MPRQSEHAVSAPSAMEKIEEALKFLVRLANTEIDELKRTPDDPAGLPTTLYQLRRYLDVTGEGKLNSAIDKARDRPNDLKKLIAAVKKLLTAAISGNLSDSEFVLKEPRRVRLAIDEGQLVSQRDGDLRETIIDVAIEDLADTEVKLLRVGHCQRQGCGNFFFKVKLNQTYCDHRCANRAAADRRTAKTGAKANRAKIPSTAKMEKEKDDGTQTKRG